MTTRKRAKAVKVWVPCSPDGTLLYDATQETKKECLRACRYGIYIPIESTPVLCELRPLTPTRKAKRCRK